MPFSTTVVAFRALVKTQHSTVIKCFKCDLGGEYTSNKFCELFALDGTIHQTSYKDTPKQNGVAKRKHRHIIKTAHSLLLFAYVPSEFWGEIVLTAISLINIISSFHSSGFSRFEKLYGYVHVYSSFRVFGCTCFIFCPYVERSKLSSRSTICVFPSYGEGKKGYRCFDPITQKLYVSRHVVFLEHIQDFQIYATENN
jgi:histone deacetylase 1/2